MTDGFLSYSDCLLEAKYCLNASHELSTISARFMVVSAVFSDKRTSQPNAIAEVKKYFRHAMILLELPPCGLEFI